MLKASILRREVASPYERLGTLKAGTERGTANMSLLTHLYGPAVLRVMRLFLLMIRHEKPYPSATLSAKTLPHF